jgi:hypothetical protein
MNTAQRLTPMDRDRALQRLRHLTTGVAMAGLSATIGLGWMAANSNPGTSASVAATTQSVSGVTATTDDSGTDDSRQTRASTSSSTSVVSSLGSTSVSGATSGGSAHVSGGGS